MGVDTNISWCDHTFNPWRGCTKVGPGCALCYAERYDNRWGGGHWGAGAPRRPASEAYWAQPIAWNRKHAHHNTRGRVFCASLADVFDNEVPSAWRIRLFDLIRKTPHLDWLLLTKRIGNAPAMLPPDWGDGFPNVWLGATVVNQDEADRDIPKLLRIDAAVRFLSIEPMLGPINLRLWSTPRVDWVICGGESGGTKARRYDLAWPRDLRDQCSSAGVAFFHKQLGCTPFQSGDGVHTLDTAYPIKNRSGADPAEWPADLRVQQFPMGSA